MHRQPKWKLLGNLGDASPLDYGGYLVYRDETGQYTEEAEYWAEPETEGGAVTVYRFILYRCTLVNGVLSDNSFHPEIRAWFADGLDGVAHSAGMEARTLRDLVCSADPMDRAAGYRAIGEHHGWDNLDHDPIRLTRAEAEARYPEFA